MTPEQISLAIVQALGSLVAGGKLPEFEIPSEVVVERPKNRDHGDWASNVAMQYAAKVGVRPRDFADALAAELSNAEGVEKVEVAGPGFLNLFVSDSAAASLAKLIVEAQESYGKSSEMAGVKLNLEFVSANPTGPIHLGHTRWAAVGDALARVLIAAGAAVTREFYINDRGVQMDLFGASIRASALGIERPEAGYQGAYIDEIWFQYSKQN